MLQAKILKRILLLTWKLCFWLPESLTQMILQIVFVFNQDF